MTHSLLGIFQLCGMVVKSFGHNLACIDSLIDPYYTSRGLPTVTDRGYTSLGHLSNVGDWGNNQSYVLDPTLPAPDVVRVLFLMKVRSLSFRSDL